eukprot:6434361-Prymnesium_polylepis.1
MAAPTRDMTATAIACLGIVGRGVSCAMARLTPTRGAAVSCAMIALLLAIFSLHTAVQQHRGAACRYMLQGLERIQLIWKTAGMRFKIKAAVGFYQCIAAVPGGLNVVPP